MGELAERAEAERVAHGVAHQRPAVERLELVRVVPQPVGPADLDVDEPVRRLPGLDERVPAHRHAAQAQRVLDERPRRISIGPGVTTRKRSSGGVIASRLRASAKNGKTALGRPGEALLAPEDVDVHRSLRLRPYASLRMTDLRSAPVPGLRADDHVRGPDGGPLVLFYADFACPRCAVAHERLRAGGVRVVFRHFALKAKHPRAVALAHAAEAAARPGRVLGVRRRAVRRPGAARGPAPVGAVRGARPRRRALRAPTAAAQAVAERVARDVRDALRAGATATPTLWRPGARTDRRA